MVLSNYFPVCRSLVLLRSSNTDTNQQLNYLVLLSVVLPVALELVCSEGFSSWFGCRAVISIVIVLRWSCWSDLHSRWSCFGLVCRGIDHHIDIHVDCGWDHLWSLEEIKNRINRYSWIIMTKLTLKNACYFVINHGYIAPRNAIWLNNEAT